MLVKRKKQEEKISEDREKILNPIPPKPVPKPKPKPFTMTPERKEAAAEIARLADMMVELGKKIDTLIAKDEEVHEKLDEPSPEPELEPVK